MSQFPDPYDTGASRGWKIHDATMSPLPEAISCDVAIIGSGAGAGITADLLSKAGLHVVIIEEGPLRSSRDFRQRESEAYTQLYQESAARKTADKAITILQGRCVGGSTTVNWTSSFRTPASTLEHWRRRYGLDQMSPTELAPWFEQAERRLGVGSWDAAPNENNDVLRRGAAKLGIPTESIRRNVQGCWNLGSCGMGCPTNAKQSMLVTTIPAALDRGSRLFVNTRAERYVLESGRIGSLICSCATKSAKESMRITAKHHVLAGGAINSPGVLLRSKAPDPHDRLGKRTFLHPVVISAAVFDTPIAGWDGAPQTICSDHFLATHEIDGPIGYKLEAPPLHPLIFATTLPGFGAEQAELLKNFGNTQALLALLRDGFHEQSSGGAVRLRSDGSPMLDYPLTDFVMQGARRALLSMAEIQFAAGAKMVLPLHELATPMTRWAQAKTEIGVLPMKPLLTRVVSAHVMGGCGMSSSEHDGVVRPDGRHWQVDNLSVFDGSMFPTSIGANPQLSIYGIVNRLASSLAKSLSGRDVSLI